MQVEVERTESGYRYRIFPDDDDPRESLRDFSHVAERGILLARRDYRVELPKGAAPPHADLHAAAIWFSLKPFVASSLRLPFGVSAPFARVMSHNFGIELPHVDAGLAPRQPPASARPSLLFSGGVDSTAIAQLMPEDTAFLFLDRIAHVSPNDDGSPKLVDLEPHRAVCRLLGELGGEVLSLRDEHEYLMEPYPTWHSEMSVLPGLYLADTVGTRYLDTGDVLDVFCYRGYHTGVSEPWRFDPRGVQGEFRTWTPEAFAAAKRGPTPNLFANLPVLGLDVCRSGAGLSEVATAIIVNRGPFRDKTFSCYYDTGSNFCMRCDKCFKKILLARIVEDREVEPELFDHFLRFPHLAAIFTRPYFDWHHIWYYIFQKIHCDHWFVAELQKQTREGPNLAVLEKWYPRAAGWIPPAYRAELVANIGRHVATMSAAEVAALHATAIPPLSAPPVPPDYKRGEPSPWPGHETAAPEFGERPTTWRVELHDREAPHPPLTFFVGEAEAGDAVFARAGRLALAHAPCEPDEVFGAWAGVLRSALGALVASGGPLDRDALATAIARAASRTPLRRRFRCRLAKADSGP